MKLEEEFEWVSATPGGGVRVGRSKAAVVVEWAGIGRVRAAPSGRGAVFIPAQETDARVLEHFCATDLLACTRYLEGRCSLHASAVSCGAGAIALIGDSGAGKSTMAMAMVERAGAAFIADDILPVDWEGDVPVAVPVDDKHWMTGEACQWLGVERAGNDKRGVTPRRRARAAVPLRMVVKLAFDDCELAPRLLRLSGRASFMSLSAVHLSYPLDGETPIRDLDVRARLASRAPVFELRRPRGPDALSASIELLLRYSSQEPPP